MDLRPEQKRTAAGSHILCRLRHLSAVTIPGGLRRYPGALVGRSCRSSLFACRPKRGVIATIGSDGASYSFVTATAHLPSGDI